ncbi:MAG: gamma-glutamyltransferase [Acidipila sp.]|nr:gamma-glutamyltransferase [Acidipila sp.]
MKKFWFTSLILMVGAATISTGGDTQDRSQGRSMVISRGGIVAAESPLAAQAGAAVLAKGGSAADAAVAANAAMGVVSPMMNGMGGDLFAIVYEAKSGKLYGLNASGWAPAALSPDFLRKQGMKEMPQAGIHSVTVPGVVDGWAKLLTRFGRLKLSDDLAGAIRLAEEGFPVTEWVSEYWSDSAQQVRGDANAAKTYLPGGHSPRLGEIFRNADLAASFRLLSGEGRDAFYKGDIARRILATSARLGGTMTAADLAEYSAEWVEPLSTTYRGWKVYEIPPNGQGLAALMMLNVMENSAFPPSAHNSADVLHVMIEAKKLAYADLLRYIGDPKFSKLPVAELLSKERARRRAAEINPARANCDVAAGRLPAAGDTTYLSVVDREGNMVSLIQSNYEGFGSGIVADGTGFALHDRGGLFSLDASSPNVLAGRKRPLHTIIPAMMEKDGVRIAFGIMGGWNQSQAHAQFVANVADFGMNIQAALEAPRFTKYSFGGCDVAMEGRIPQAVRQALESRGHKIKLLGDYSENMGGGQAVLRDFARGVNYGASDPRKDGAAIPEP